MRKSGIYRAVVWLMIAMTVNFGSPLTARAGIVDTLTVIQSGQRTHDLATVSAVMARQDVRAKFEALGVSPVDVEQRLANLTDAELRTLAAKIEQQPAGGDFWAVLGITFLVLLILELVGVIDIFKKFP
jgi:hypothetical protein